MLHNLLPCQQSIPHLFLRKKIQLIANMSIPLLACIAVVQDHFCPYSFPELNCCDKCISVIGQKTVFGPMYKPYCSENSVFSWSPIYRNVRFSGFCPVNITILNIQFSVQLFLLPARIVSVLNHRGSALVTSRTNNTSPVQSEHKYGALPSYPTEFQLFDF